MKKFILISLILIFLSGVFIPHFVRAQEKPEINFFFSPACQHCADEKVFLNELEQKYPGVHIKRHDITKKKNSNLFKNFYTDYDVPKNEWGLVPMTFSKDKYFLGFNPTIAENIEECIEACISGSDAQDSKNKISLPFVGEIDMSRYSIPVLAVILGSLDGFNVCSLGVLIFILTLVLTLKSRKKTLLLGGFFILTTSLVYGILMTIWYQLFAFLFGYLRILEILLGLLGIGGAIYYLKEFLKFRKYGPVCKISSGHKIMARFKEFFKGSKKKQGLFFSQDSKNKQGLFFSQGSKNIFLLVSAIFLFAGVVTIIEFPCSALVPVAFAGVLAKAQLSTFFYILYISIFVLFYMLDELIIFLIAFFSMKIWFANNKFLTTWVLLIQAVVLFFLGVYYLIL